MMDNFYITLISNNKSDLKNSPSSFRTYLPKNLELFGEWECGLVEMSFQRSWNNVADTEEDTNPGFKQTSFQITPFMKDNRILWPVLDVAPGYYDSIGDLLENLRHTYQKWALNADETVKESISNLERHIKSMRGQDAETKENKTKFEEMLKNMKERKSFLNAFQMDYDNNRKRVVICVDNNNLLGVEFSKHLGYVLGLKENFYFSHTPTPTDSTTEFIAEYPTNLTTGTNSLYVYADIIQPTIVSDTMTRLLRIVNGTGQYAEFITKEFIKPYDLPVAYSSINRIEIEIKDEMDKLVKFAYGITIVKLHFQKRKRFPIQ